MQLTIEPGRLVVEVQPGEVVLDALRRCGLAIRSGCRRGGCGLCKADVVSGSVDHPVGAAETALPPGERADGACLPCRAVLLEDSVLRVRSDGPRRLVTGSSVAAPRVGHLEQQGE